MAASSRQVPCFVGMQVVVLRQTAISLDQGSRVRRRDSWERRVPLPPVPPPPTLTLTATQPPTLHASLLRQIYGPEASGKTTLAMHAAAEIQRLGGVVAYIDVEHAFDRQYALVGIVRVATASCTLYAQMSVCVAASLQNVV